MSDASQSDLPLPSMSGPSTAGHETKTDAPSEADSPPPASTPPSVTTNQAQLGEYPPDYEILGVLGRGGMGVVYKARQPRLNRLVALKMIQAGKHATPDELRRFRAEAEAVARLQHPNIVQIYEVGNHNDLPFFSLEFVKGGSLAQKLDGTPQPARPAAQLVETLARAMHEAHQQGIVHRDLKPANVLLALSREPETRTSTVLTSGLRLNECVPKITDFGLAKRLDSDVGQTRSGAILGTPCYMSPEQAAGKTRQIGPAADIYALGVILYELITGRPPLLGEGPLDTIILVLHQDPIPPSRLQPKVPRDLETICLKCLEKETAKRYATARDLAEDLRRYQANEPITARPVSASEQVFKWVRRRPAIAALLGLLLLVTVLGFAGVTQQWLQTRDALDQARASEHAEAIASAAAKEQARRAEEESGKAKTAQQESERQADILRRQLYVSNLNRAAQMMDLRRIGQALDLLNGQRPPPGKEDLRGFEWYCLMRQCNGARVTLAEQAGPVNDLAYSPDGQTLAVACIDGTVRLWDPTTSQFRTTLRGTQSPISGIQGAFSPDGKLFALVWDSLGHGDGEVQLWDTTTYRRQAVWKQPALTCLAFSPDSKHLAVGDWNNCIHIWEIARKQKSSPLRGHTEPVWHLAFSPDGKTLASANQDQTIRLWDVASGKERVVLRGHNQPVAHVAFSADGKTLASGSRFNAKVWNLTTNQEQASLNLPDGSVRTLAFAPDNHTLAVAYNLSSLWGEIRLWDLRTRREEILMGHTATILSLAFAPDGKTLASGSSDRTVKLWDVHPWPEWGQLDGHRDRAPISSVAVTADGKRAATASYDRTIKLWDLVTGKLQATLTGHGERISEVAFTPNGKTLVSVDHGGEVKVWDTVQLLEKHADHLNEAPLTSVAIAPNGNTVAIGAARSVAFLNLATGEFGDPLELQSQIFALAYSADGRFLAIGGTDGVVRLYDPTTAIHASLRAHTTAVASVAFSPDGRYLATGGFDKLVKLWDPVTRKERAVLPGHTGRVRVVAFSPDGKQLVSGGEDRDLRLWDVATGTLLGSMQTEHPIVSAAAFALDGKKVLAGYSVGAVCLWDVVLRGQPLTLGWPLVSSLAFSPDGKTFASTDCQTVKLWDVASRTEKGRLGFHRHRVNAIAFAPDGKLLASADGNMEGTLPGEIKLWDLATQTEKATWNGCRFGVSALAFSPDGKWLTSGGGSQAGSEVHIWDVAKGRPQKSATDLKQRVRSLAFSPNGQILAIAEGDDWINVPGTLKLWDVATGREVPGPVKQHRGPIYAVQFAPDGKTVATGSADNTIIFWDVATGRRRATLWGHANVILSLAFSPDGRRLASVGYDKTIRIWDSATAQELTTLKGYRQAIHSVAFSPDGQMLVTGGEPLDQTGGIRLWEAAPAPP